MRIAGSGWREGRVEAQAAGAALAGRRHRLGAAVAEEMRRGVGLECADRRRRVVVLGLRAPARHGRLVHVLRQESLSPAKPFRPLLPFY